jgi:ADP-heptose:LPS heptosyltransferase
MSKRILVINLTRFGDIIQSQPLFSYLHQQGKEVALLCLENFQAAARLLQYVDKIYTFPGGEILASLSKDKWWKGLEQLFASLERIKRDFQPEQVINLTPSLSAKILTLVLGKETLGFALDKWGFSTYNNSWAAFLQASSKFREASPINLIDLYLGIVDSQKQANVRLELRATSEDSIGKWKKFFHLPPGYGLIGFQLGASDNKRRWPVAYFVRVGKICLQKFKLIPVLLGTESEIELANRFEQLADYSHFNLVGKTELKDLQAILSQLTLLLTNDTGTMHLAAGTNLKVVALFLATAQAWDTGPYLEDCICLEPNLDCHPCNFDQVCNDYKCRYAIQPEDVILAIKLVLDKEYKSLSLNSRIYKTTFLNNTYFLENLNHNKDKRYLNMSFFHFFYFNFLVNNLDFKNKHNFVALKLDDKLKQELSEIESYFFLFKEQLRSISAYPLTKRKQKISLFHLKLTSKLEQTRYFYPLTHLWLAQSQQGFSSVDDFYQLAHQYHSFLRKVKEKFF